MELAHVALHRRRQLQQRRVPADDGGGVAVRRREGVDVGRVLDAALQRAQHALLHTLLHLHHLLLFLARLHLALRVRAAPVLGVLLVPHFLLLLLFLLCGRLFLRVGVLAVGHLGVCGGQAGGFALGGGGGLGRGALCSSKRVSRGALFGRRSVGHGLLRRSRLAALLLHRLVGGGDLR